MGKCADCKSCNKKGIPILLTRYAVASREANAPNADTEIWATMGEEQGLMTPDKPTEGDQTYKYGNIYLGHSAHYTRRLLRSGFVYLFDEKRNTWHAWMVTDLGYYVWFNPKIFDDKEMDPFDEREKGEKKVYCEEAIDAPRLTTITIPGPASEIGALWIAFSDAKWTKAVFKKHQYSAYRAKHMRAFDFKRWSGGAPHPHAKKISEIGQTVAEYADNGYRGCIDFHFSSSDFNYPRHKMSDALLGNAGIPAIDNGLEEFSKLTNTRQGYKNFLLPPPVKPAAVAAEVKNLLGKEEIFDDTYDIRLHGVGYPGKTVALCNQASKTLPFIKANSTAVNKQLIETLSKMSPHAAIFTLDDPAGIASDLAHLAHLRVESYSIARIKDEDYKRKASCCAGIQRIKDAVEQQTLEKIDKGDIVNEPGLKRVQEYMYRNRFNYFSRRDPSLPGILKALYYPTPEEKADIIKNKWKDYDEEYSEGKRQAFEKEEISKKTTFDLNFVIPILDAYIRWLDSYRLSWYMQCNYDENSLESGTVYASVVSAVVADIQSHKQGQEYLRKALTSEAGFDKSNFLLRALAHNKKEPIEVLEIAQQKLAELEDSGFKSSHEDMDDVEFRLRVAAKLAVFEEQDKGKEKPIKSVAEFQTALEALTTKIKSDDSAAGKAAGFLAVWNSTISAFFTLLYSQDNLVKPTVQTSAHNVLSRLITQYTGVLFDAFSNGAVTRSVGLQRLCTLVGTINRTPVTRVVRHMSQAQALNDVLRYFDENLARTSPKGKVSSLPKKHWTRQLKQEIFNLRKDPVAAKASAANLKKFTQADMKLIKRFVNGADLPDDLRLTLKSVTGSEFFDMEDSKAMRRVATVVMIDESKFRIPDKATRDLLAENIGIRDNPGSSRQAKESAKMIIDRIAKQIIQGVHVHDPNIIAFTIDGNGNWQQQAAQRAASQHLEDELGRMAAKAADRIQGVFTICGVLAQAVGIAAAIQLISSGKGKPGEGWSKLVAGYMGLVGMVFDRATALLEAGRPLKGMTKMLSHWSQRAIKIVGKALGAVAGVIMAVWDFVSAFEAFHKGQMGIASLYLVSSGLGVASVVALIVGAAIPVVLVLVALALAVAILIMIFTPDPYEEWLSLCYFGNSKRGKYTTLDQEMFELKKVFNLDGAKPEKDEEFIGGHANPIGVRSPA